MKLPNPIRREILFQQNNTMNDMHVEDIQGSYSIRVCFCLPENMMYINPPESEKQKTIMASFLKNFVE